MFKVIKKSKISQARLGVIKTPHGLIETPCFMPDATRGVVKQLTSSELNQSGLSCLVANTLHLYLRPGLKLMKQAGDLHALMNWPKPILTDSGGYQVYSLIHKNKNGLGGKITDEAAFFNSPLDGAKIKLTPELSIKTQFILGSDLIVCLDDCPPNDYSKDQIKNAVERTIKWARRCKLEFTKQLKARGFKNNRPLLLAVIQGGYDQELRDACALELNKIGFDGFGFGARHVDESGRFLTKVLTDTAELIDESEIRFGLGIGLPEDITRAVKMGWDLFDCVIPTREGRHGKLFLKTKNLTAKSLNFYQTINITNAKFSKDFSPINQRSKIADLRDYSKAYLNYLFKIGEPLGQRLASLNNLEFYLDLLAEIRNLIKQGKF